MKNLLLFCLFIVLTITTKASSNHFNANWPNPIDTVKKGKGYYILSKSENIQNIFVTKKGKSSKEIIRIKLGYSKDAPKSNVITSGNVIGNVAKDAPSLPTFGKIDILKGSYKDFNVEQESVTKSLSTIGTIEFPLKLKLSTGSEFIEIEFYDAGEWNVDIDLKK